MAATYKDNGGSVNGSNKVFTYDFPVLQTEDIKVALNGVTQATTKYTPSLSPANITFNNTSVDSSVQESDGSPKSGVTVRVYRETTVGTNTGNEDPKAVFAAGSSIRAGDLNANVEQALFGIHELQEQLILTESINTGAVTSVKIENGTIVNDDISATAGIGVNKLAHGTDNQILQSDNNGNVEWVTNVQLPGNLDVNFATTVGTTLSIVGTTTAAAINASGAVGVDGNFDVNTDKFTVAAATGNTNIAGYLYLKDDKELVLGDDNNFILEHRNSSNINTIDTDIQLQILKKGTSQQLAYFTPDGKTVLGYAGTERVETTNAGAKVTGNLEVTGSITGNVTGALTGDAATATALLNGRTISSTGDVTWTSGSFDGTANVTGTATIANDVVGPDELANTSVTAGSYGSSTSIPSITVDAQGRVTAASGNSVNFDVVADTTPQLGGNLDVNGKDIITTSNSDIELDPDGSGKVVFKGNATKGSGQFKLNCENNSHAITIKGPPHSAAATYTLTLPNNDGDTGQYLKTDGVGNLSWDTVSGGGGGGSGTAAPNNIVTFSGNIDGNNKTYSLSVTPDSAQNLIVSLNGVVQKPNAGTSIANSEEGYCVNGGNLIFATAPASGSSMFITELSATAASDSIVEGNSKVDVFDDNATAHVKIELDGAEKFRVYQNGEIGLGGANYGSSGQFLKSQGSGSPAVWATPTDTNTQLSTEEVQDIVGGMVSSNTETNITVTYDDTNGKLNFVSTDTNTQVGGATGVDFNDDVYIRLGTGNDLKIWHNAGGNSYIRNESGNLLIEANSAGDDAIKIISDGATELYWDNERKFYTQSWGATVEDTTNTNAWLQFTTQDGICGYLVGASNAGAGSNEKATQLYDASGGELSLQGITNGTTELYWDGSKKLETTSTGVQITDNLGIGVAPSRELHVKGLDGTIRLESTAATGRTWIEFFDTSAIKGSIGYPSSGNDNLAIQQSENADMYFTTNDAERVRINNDGYTTFKNDSTGSNSAIVGFGGHSWEPKTQVLHSQGLAVVRTNDVWGGALHLASSRGTYASPSASNNGDRAGGVYFSAHDGTDYKNYTAAIESFVADSVASDDTPGYLKFSTASDGQNSLDAKMYIQSNGDVQVEKGDLILGTDGKGILFHAHAAENKLDDYEEGTWTPNISFGGNAVGVTHTTSTGGSYTKIGRMVYIHGRIGLSSKGSSSGSLLITGLPFTPGNRTSGTSSIEGGIYFTYNQDWISGLDKQNPIGYINVNNTTIEVYYNNDSGDLAAISDSDFEDATGLSFEGQYPV